MSIYGQYIHIRCDEPGCNGVVVLRRPTGPGIFGYECDKCGKHISHYYVDKHKEFNMVNNKTGDLYPMVRKKE